MRLAQLFFILSLVLLAKTSAGQDAHMWDSQYGTRAQLLGGLVVGAASDLSSTYYNPAWLALEKQPGILLTTKAFEASTISTDEGLGPGTEPTSSSVTPSPGYFGGKFNTIINDDEVVVAYSYMQRIKFKYEASGVRVDENPAPPPEDNYWFSGEAFKIVELSEYWSGVSFAKKIGNNIYAGVTPFGALRSHSQRTQVSAKGMDSQQEFAHYYDMSQFSYWHVRLLLKAGIAFDYKPVTFGFTITTPSIGIMGDGSVHQDQSFSGITTDPGGSTDPYLAVNKQDDLSPSYQSPLSVAAGAAYHFGNSSIYFSAEWFNGIGASDILSPETYRAQSDPSSVLGYNVSYATQSILNWGLAGKHQFTKTFTLYGSFWTDKSTIDQNSNPSTMMAEWDLWHTNMGASFEFLEIEFTSGLGYSFGRETTHRHQYFSTDDTGAVLQENPEMEMSFKRLKFLIGFNMPFGNSAD